jgi:excisionase family DNA binding protein
VARIASGRQLITRCAGHHRSIRASRFNVAVLADHSTIGKRGDSEGVAMFEPLAVSPREAADMLAISKRTVSRLIRARTLIARKRGKRTLVDVESVKAFYASLPIKATSSPIAFDRRAKRQLKPRHW